MAHRNVFTRDDTMFGICQAIGEDFGFPPTLLRVGFAIALFFAPVAVICVYFAVGAVVLASRLLVRGPRKAVAREEAVAAPARADNDALETMAAAA